MKKTYIIPQACVLGIVAHAILAGSGEPKNGGQGTTGAHGESKIGNTNFDSDFNDESME